MSAHNTHTVVLCFQDEAEKSIDVPEAQTVLASALEQGLQLASQCRSGSCGTCIVRVRHGDTEMVSGRATALLPSEYASGQRLACSTYVRSNARFDVPYESELILGPAPRQWQSRVSGLENLSESVVRLTVELERGARLPFKSGQYARLRVPNSDEWRSYSMATTPAELPRLEFLVRILPAGAMSGYLQRSCAIGDTITVDGPYGSFVLHDSIEPHLLIAGGTGLAPILAMLDTLRTRRGKRPKITLCFACMTERDLYYVDELALRSSWMPNLDVRVSVTAPTTADYSGNVGTPLSLIEDGDIAAGVRAYVCGPPAMIQAARELLANRGLPEDAISAEQFLPSAT